ncbi:unnamed protein product [Meloidogyne enterolobii]|uniref:Uncharacterized protein n=1 Tax=Meloidogyne enterolobii TaxID=390850 RepID=A0ACB0Z678_MELEN
MSARDNFKKRKTQCLTPARDPCLVIFEGSVIIPKLGTLQGFLDLNDRLEISPVILFSILKAVGLRQKIFQEKEKNDSREKSKKGKNEQYNDQASKKLYIFIYLIVKARRRSVGGKK